MEAPARIPPVIAEIAPSRRSLMPLYVFAFVALAILVSVFSAFFDLGFPKCSFKMLTGLPCSFCGGTRSLRAIGHLSFSEAFWWNPLVMLGVIGAVAWFISWLALPAAKLDRWTLAFKRLPLLFIGLVLVAVNWIFVLKFLPR